MAKTTKSGWKCERCLNCGTLHHDKHTNIYEIVGLIEAAHAVEAGMSCKLDLSKMSVWPINLVAEQPVSSSGEETRNG